MCWSSRSPFVSGLILILLFGIQSVWGALVNTTIDDQLGDPLTGAQIAYSPSGAWSNGTEPCTSCTAQPNATQLYDGTYHEGDFNPFGGVDPNQVLTASVPFNGSALYIYCVLAHSQQSPNGNSDMSFYIDGYLVGNFTLPPVTHFYADSEYQYDVPVYVNESIPDGPHVFALHNGQTGGEKSLVLLDYIVYTHAENDATNSTSPSSSTSASSTKSTNKTRNAIIIGSILGGVGLGLVALGIVLCIRMRRRRRRMAPSTLYIEKARSNRWGGAGGIDADVGTTPNQSTDDVKSIIIDQEPAAPATAGPSSSKYYPEALRSFIARGARAMTRSDTGSVKSASQSTSIRDQPPPVPGRRMFRVVNV